MKDIQTGIAAAALVLCLGASGLRAQDQPTTSATLPAPGGTNRRPARIEFPKPIPPPKPIESSVTALTNNPIKVVGPGLFEIANVRIDKARRTVSFPATLNRVEGLMEYFLVTNYGKTHESVLRTDATPYHIHLAMLLLGAEGAGTNTPPGIGPQSAPGWIRNPSEAVLPGDKVSVEVSWSMNGRERRCGAEDLVFSRASGSPLAPGNWVYNGSFVLNGRFFAQMDGSIVSLITDPVALINNTGQGHNNDRIWTANTNSLPPADVPLQVAIKIEDKPKD